MGATLKPQGTPGWLSQAVAFVPPSALNMLIQVGIAPSVVIELSSPDDPSSPVVLSPLIELSLPLSSPVLPLLEPELLPLEDPELLPELDPLLDPELLPLDEPEELPLLDVEPPSPAVELLSLQPAPTAPSVRTPDATTQPTKLQCNFMTGLQRVRYLSAHRHLAGIVA
jgi:hypothetical protein